MAEASSLPGWGVRLPLVHWHPLRQWPRVIPAGSPQVSLNAQQLELLPLLISSPREYQAHMILALFSFATPKSLWDTRASILLHLHSPWCSFSPSNIHFHKSPLRGNPVFLNRKSPLLAGQHPWLYLHWLGQTWLLRVEFSKDTFRSGCFFDFFI